MSLENDLKILDKIEKAETKKLQTEQKTEQEIINAIEEITSNLLLRDVCEADINGKQYLIKFKCVNTGKNIINSKGQEVPEKMMFLAASNIAKSKIFRERYIPMTIRFPFDDDLTFKGNLTVAVEATVRHITGTIKPEELGQEKDPVKVEVKK